MKKPFSKNVIFFDAEFSGLDPQKNEIISFALIKETGEELYLEIRYEGECSDWVVRNVLPTLTNKKVSKSKACEEIHKFVGSAEPFLISYVSNLDSVLLHKLFGGIGKWPFFWMPIDFASVLFAEGIDPEVLKDKDKKFFEEYKIKETYKHHALSDARLLRETYLKMTNDKKK